MSKLTVFTLLPLYAVVIILLLSLSYSSPVLAVRTIDDSMSAADYVKSELLKAGWREEAAENVVAVNKAWFTIVKQQHENDFHYQVNLIKQLDKSVIISRFLRKHPETAGLLALSDNPIRLIKTLKKPACYNALTSFYALHATPKDVQLLTEALEKHRDLMCQLFERGILGTETVFIFPRHTKGAIEYDAWLEWAFGQYLQRSDDKLAEIIGFIIENGKSIRQRLDKKPDFYKRFRKELWPALIRVVDNNGAFEWLANEPHIWEVLALKEGEMLLNKWGLGPISLLFGKDSYGADMRTIIIQILLQGDDNTVEALFRYKDEPLFGKLMRRPLSASSQAALANKLVSMCPNYPEQACPDLPNHLRYFASITDNAALAEEVGVLQSGAITWIPFHGSYYAIKKMIEGREINGEDILNLGLDALIFVPAAFFAGTFTGAIQPLAEEIVLNIGIVGLEVLSFTPYRYHIVKPLGKFAIRTGSRTSKMLIQQQEMARLFTLGQGRRVIVGSATRSMTAFMKQSQQIFSQLGKQKQRVSYEVTKPILFLHEKAGLCGCKAKILIEFEASVFLRNDAKVVMNPVGGLGGQFFRETAERALSAQSARLAKRNVSAWQQNISAWWLMNAAVAQ